MFLSKAPAEGACAYGIKVRTGRPTELSQHGISDGCSSCISCSILRSMLCNPRRPLETILESCLELPESYFKLSTQIDHIFSAGTPDSTNVVSDTHIPYRSPYFQNVKRQYITEMALCISACFEIDLSVVFPVICSLGKQTQFVSQCSTSMPGCFHSGHANADSMLF